MHTPARAAANRTLGAALSAPDCHTTPTSSLGAFPALGKTHRDLERGYRSSRRRNGSRSAHAEAAEVHGLVAVLGEHGKHAAEVVLAVDLAARREDASLLRAREELVKRGRLAVRELVAEEALLRALAHALALLQARKHVHRLRGVAVVALERHPPRRVRQPCVHQHLRKVKPRHDPVLVQTLVELQLLHAARFAQVKLARARDGVVQLLVAVLRKDLAHLVLPKALARALGAALHHRVLRGQLLNALAPCADAACHHQARDLVLDASTSDVGETVVLDLIDANQIQSLLR
eukprot:2313678-Rhodomonas_salina.1